MLLNYFLFLATTIAAPARTAGTTARATPVPGLPLPSSAGLVSTVSVVSSVSAVSITVGCSVDSTVSTVSVVSTVTLGTSVEAPATTTAATASAEISVKPASGVRDTETSESAAASTV